MSRATPGVWLSAVRLFAFPASLLSLLVGTAAAAPAREWKWGVLAAEIVAVACLHGIGNLLNDYFDYRSGVDTRTEEDEGRPGRCLVKGLLQPRDVLWLVFVLAIPLLPLGAFLIWKGGAAVALLVGVGLVGGYAYTGKPFELKYHALGEVCIFLVYGPAIVAGASIMQTGHFDPRVLLYAIPLGMLITAIVSANFLRDFDEDARSGIRTLAKRLGRPAYRWLYLAMMFGPALFLMGAALAGLVPPWVLLGLLALPLGLPPARCALRDIRRPDADAMTAKYMTAFGAMVFLGLILAGWG